jgi:hypothetical protein
MSTAPFEHYINRLLNQHDALDLLRQNALDSPERHTKLQTAVDKVLLENYLEQYYLDRSYPSMDVERSVLNKLNYLRNKLISNKVPEDSVFVIIIDFSLYKINLGCSLNKDLLNYLNKVNNRYE